MGVPLVQDQAARLLDRRRHRRDGRRLPGPYNNAINSNQFQFSFSIFVLSMIILGGLGSIWGAVIGGLALTFIDRTTGHPRPLEHLPQQARAELGLTDLSIGIFGFLLVIMMILRPQGLFPRSGASSSSPRASSAEDVRGARPRTSRKSPTEREQARRREAADGGAGGCAATGSAARGIVRRPDRGRRRQLRHPAPVDRVDHRPERRRQDDVLQHAHRPLQADHGADLVRRRATSRRCGRTRSWRRASRGRSRTSACSAR